MTVRRLAPYILSTTRSLEDAHGAVWKVLDDADLSGLVLDREKNLLVGLSPSWGISRNFVSVAFAQEDSEIFIGLRARVIPFQSGDRAIAAQKIERLTDAIATLLNSSWRPDRPPPRPPIAEPTGIIFKPDTLPRVGKAWFPRWGLHIFFAGLVSIFCCLGVPFVVTNGWRAWHDYGDDFPGDKKWGVAGLMLSLLSCGIFMLYLLHFLP